MARQQDSACTHDASSGFKNQTGGRRWRLSTVTGLEIRGPLLSCQVERNYEDNRQHDH